MSAPHPTGNGDGWLRLADAARLLGVSQKTLRRWSDGGRLPCYRSPGGHRRYRRLDLAAVLTTQEVTARRAAGLAAAPSPAAGRARPRQIACPPHTPEDATPFELAERRNATLTDLVELGALMSQTRDLRSLVRTVAERLVQTLDVADCDIFRMHDAHELRCLVSVDRGGMDESVVDKPLELAKFAPSAEAVRTKEAVVVAARDDRLTKHDLAVYEKFGFHSELCIPLLNDGRVGGLIEIYDDRPRDFSEYLDFTRSVGQIVAGAYENAVLLERLADSNRELASLVESGLEFGASLDREQVLRSVALRMCRAAAASCCDIYELDGDIMRGLVSCAGDEIDEGWGGTTYALASLNIARRAVESRQPVQVFDVVDDRRVTDFERREWLRWDYHASLRLPLVTGGRVIGVASLFDERPRSWERLELLQGLAQIAAQAIANASLLEQVEERNEVQRELVDIGALVSQTRDPHALARQLAPRLVHRLDAVCCDIWSRQGEELRLLASCDVDGFDDESVGRVLDLPRYSATRTALESREVLVVTSPADSRLSPLEREVFEQWGYESLVSVPLVIEDRVVGMIDVYDERHRDWAGDVDFVRSVSQLMAAAVESALLLEQLGTSIDELRMLVDASLVLGATLDFDEVLGRAARSMCQAVHGACCDIYQFVDGDAVGLVSADGDALDDSFPGTTYPLADLAISRLCIDSKELQRVYDVVTDERVTALERAEFGRHGLRSAVHLPLINAGRVIGMATVFDTKPRRFRRVELLRGLAQLVAQATANASLYSQLDRSAERMALVNESSIEFSSTLELDDVLLATAQRLCAIVDVPRCDIFRREGGETLIAVVSVTDSSPDPAFAEHALALRSRRAARQAVTTRKPLVVSTPRDGGLSGEERAFMRQAGAHSMLVVPLIAKDSVIGIVEVLETRRERDFSQEDIATAEAVCRVAALAIDNADLFCRLALRSRETELLNEIARKTTASLNLADIAAATARELRQLVPWERSSMVLAEDGQLRAVYSSDERPSLLEAAPVSALVPGVAERLARERVIVLEFPEDDPFGAYVTRLSSEVRSAAVIALLQGDEVIGAFNLASSERGSFATVDRRLLERVGTQLSLAVNNARLYEEIKRMHLSNLKVLSSALHAKDYYTLGHAARVAAYMLLLGHELGWTPETVQLVEQVAYLHDIGKIGVSDRILQKPSALNDREWDLMHQHPVFSADIVRPLFPEDLVAGVRHHHERYDGSGYPAGLKGDDIPLVARAMCVVDSYDAMSFRRPYRNALTYPECLEELARCRGTHFDPLITDAFVRVLARMQILRTNAQAVATQAAARIDAGLHARLREPDDEARPEYAEIAAILREVRDANPPTRYLTTHARRDRKFVIVCDAEEDQTLRSTIGDEVFADEDLPEIFAGGSAITNVLFVDEYGVWVSGLAPIRNAKGEVSAAVSADMPPLEDAELAGLRSEVTQTFAAMLQSAAMRMSRAEIDAITDGLTGLYNHRYLHERLKEELQRAREQSKPLSVLFCDIDRFKRFNDEHGHNTGDGALRSVARILEGAIRHTDLAARYGGEEFVVVLIEADTEAALIKAEEIRAGVEAAHLAPGTGRVTISIGVASYPSDATEKEGLLDRADWAMYLAKRQGRNRVMPFSAEDGKSLARRK